MNIVQVSNCVKQGTKIRRKRWGKYTYISFEWDSFTGKLYFLTQSRNPFFLAAHSILANDWELIE